MYVEGLRARSFWLSPAEAWVGAGGSLVVASMGGNLFHGFGAQVTSAVGAGLWLLGCGAYACVYIQRQPWLPVYAIVTVHERDRWGQVVLRTEERFELLAGHRRQRGCRTGCSVRCAVHRARGSTPKEPRSAGGARLT